MTRSPVHPATWLAAIVALWLVALSVELGGAWWSSTLAEHEQRAVIASVSSGLLWSSLAAVLSVLPAYALARVVPLPWLVGLALVSPLTRAYGVLALGVPPGGVAMVLASAGEGVPLCALLVAMVLRGRPTAWLEAAADLGASPRQRFLRIEWPVIRSALGVSAAWIALRSMGDAVVPEIAGGGKVYGPGLLLRDAIGSDAAPGRAALLLLVLMLGSAAVAWWATGRDVIASAVRRERGRLPAGAGLRSIAALGLLLAALGVLALVPGFTVGWERADSLLAAALSTTLGLGALVAAIAAVAALVAADPRAPSRATRTLLLLPLALPPSVVGLGALAVATGRGHGPSHALTVLAVLPWALSLGSVTGWLLGGRIPRRAFEAAADLGASARQRLLRIRLPLSAPAMLAAAALAFAWIVADRAITGFTAPPGGGTVAVSLAALIHGGAWATAVRWSLMLAVVPLAAVVLAAWLGGGRRRG